MYDIANRSSGAIPPITGGVAVTYSFIAGSTSIPVGTTNKVVSIAEIAGLSLGNQVHITATAYGSETNSNYNIVIEGNAGVLPNNLNTTGDVKFVVNGTAPTDGVGVMYHVMYTTEEIPG